eukprot:3639737-Pleurochrysis_carterae.AAC.1
MRRAFALLGPFNGPEFVSVAFPGCGYCIVHDLSRLGWRLPSAIHTLFGTPRSRFGSTARRGSGGGAAAARSAHPLVAAAPQHHPVRRLVPARRARSAHERTCARLAIPNRSSLSQRLHSQDSGGAPKKRGGSGG